MKNKKKFSGTGQNKTSLVGFWCILTKTNATDLSSVFSEKKKMFSRTEKHITSPKCNNFMTRIKIPHKVSTFAFYSTQRTAQHHDNEQFLSVGPKNCSLYGEVGGGGGCQFLISISPWLMLFVVSLSSPRKCH